MLQPWTSSRGWAPRRPKTTTSPCRRTPSSTSPASPRTTTTTAVDDSLVDEPPGVDAERRVDLSDERTALADECTTTEACVSTRRSRTRDDARGQTPPPPPPPPPPPDDPPPLDPLDDELELDPDHDALDADENDEIPAANAPALKPLLPEYQYGDAPSRAYRSASTSLHSRSRPNSTE